MTTSRQKTDINRQPAIFRPSPDIVGSIWRVLTRPYLLLILGALALMLIIGGLILPQLPGQLNDEPAAAARWLLTTSDTYGALGPLLRSSGMFNVLHNPALRFLLTLIGLILFVQLADSLGKVLNFHTLRTRFTGTWPQAEPEEPLSLPSYQRLYRHRFSLPDEPSITAQWAETSLRSRFQTVQQTTHSFTAVGNQSPTSAQNGSMPTADADESNNSISGILSPQKSDAQPLDRDSTQNEQSQEARVLGLQNERAVYLRPLLAMGFLVALVAIWIIVVVGWQIATPSLVPGERYRSILHDFTLAYDATINDNSVQTTIEISYGGEVISTTIGYADDSQTYIQIDQIKNAPTKIDSVNVELKTGDPAILLHAVNDDALLARPGQSRTAPIIGLSFPVPGSEETVLLPSQSAGLRIVRNSEEEEGFLVELYQGEQAEPVERLNIGSQEIHTLPLGENQVAIQLLPVTGIQAEIRYLPGIWLLWVAAGMVLLGLIGVWRDSSFILLQIRPWGQERSLIIAQSTTARELQLLHNAQQQHANPQDTTQNDTLENIQDDDNEEDAEQQKDSENIPESNV